MTAAPETRPGAGRHSAWRRGRRNETRALPEGGRYEIPRPITWSTAGRTCPLRTLLLSGLHPSARPAAEAFATRWGLQPTDSGPRLTEYSFRARIDRWRRGPVFLLGDAVHLPGHAPDRGDDRAEPWPDGHRPSARRHCPGTPRPGAAAADLAGTLWAVVKTPVGTCWVTVRPRVRSRAAFRVVQQVQLKDAEGGEHLRGGGVVAGVLGEAEVGVEALVLEGVGLELVVRADAASLLAEVEQDASDMRRCALPPRIAGGCSRSGRAEDVARQALGVQAHQRGPRRRRVRRG